jgi:phosphate:Na+ symporter
MLASIGKPREALRAAVVHTLFNVLGVVLWIGFVGQLASLVEGIGGDTARQIANAHTIFNVANALIFIWFTGWLARIAIALVEDRADPAEAIVTARHLDAALLATPSLALERARLELLRMANRVSRMLDDILPAVLEGPGTRLHGIAAQDDEVDALHAHIIKYLGKVSETRMGEGTTAEFVALMEATNAVEAIGDIIETNLVLEGLHRIEEQLIVSDETGRRIRLLHEAVVESYRLAVTALAELDRDIAKTVRNRKELIEHLEAQVLERQVERLGADAPKRGRTFRFEIDVVNHLKRIHYFTRRVARSVLPIEDQASTG